MSLKGQKRLIARAAMVSGIVTDAASLLRAIHRLDGCIQVENRILQRLHEAGDDVIVDLGQGQDARFVVEAVQSSVQRVVVRELVQAQLQAKQRVMLKLVDRSEERRVGKEWSSRGPQYPLRTQPHE